MDTLTRLQTESDALTPAERQQLLLYLAERLRAAAPPPPAPRHFAPQEVAAWLAEDDADMRRPRDDRAA